MKKKMFLMPLMLLIIGAIIVVSCAAPAPVTTPSPSPAPAPSPSPAPAPTPAPSPSPTPTPTITPTPAQPTEVFEWKFQTPWPSGFQYYSDTEELAEMIKSMSDGRLVITLFPGGALVPAYEGELPGVEEGIIDATTGGTAVTKSRFGPVADLFSQYAGGPTTDEYLAWFQEGNGLTLYRELFERETKAYLVNLSVAGCGESGIWSTKKITSLSDFKGLKIRAFGEFGKVLDGLGAAVAALPGGEVYPSLETGVIDATELSFPALDWSFGLQEVTKFLHVPGIHAPSALGELIVNKNSWNALPPDVQEIVQRAAELEAQRSYIRNAYQSAVIFGQIEDYGIEIVHWPIELQAELVKRMYDLLDQFAAEDPFYDEVLNDQREFLNTFETTNIWIPDMSAVKAAMQ